MTDPHDDDPAAGPGPADPVGSVAEEATKLFGALADWAKANQPDAVGGVTGLGERVARAAAAVDDHLATGAAECTYCPICRTVHAVRRTSPEVRTHLAPAASSLLQAAAAVLATQAPDPSPRSTGVEHIDLDEQPAEEQAGEEPETDAEGER